jgi:hypothetical protein
MSCGFAWCVTLAMVAGLSTGGAAQAGWVKAGDNPIDYDMGVDSSTAFTGSSSGFIRSKPSEPKGFGTYMQMFDASEYRGKRIRLSAYVKSEGIADWAGVWMRVDRGRTSTAFDNMQNRPITGTQPWMQHTIVLDVDPEATAIAFGILLRGKGAAWIDDIAFEVVGEDVPPTDITTTRQVAPRNLDFEVRPGPR